MKSRGADRDSEKTLQDCRIVSMVGSSAARLPVGSSRLKGQKGHVHLFGRSRRIGQAGTMIKAD